MRGKDNEYLESEFAFCSSLKERETEKEFLCCTRVTFYSIINNIVLISLQVGFHQLDWTEDLPTSNVESI